MRAGAKKPSQQSRSYARAFAQALTMRDVKNRAQEIAALIKKLHAGGGRPVTDELLAIGPEAVAPLIAAWNSNSRDIEEDFGDTILRFGRDATLPLVAALARPYAQGKVAWVLGQIKDPRALEPLVAAVASKDSSMRWSAAHGLGFLRDRRAQPALLARLRDRSENVRIAAIQSLGKLGDADALAALRPFDDKKGVGIGVFAAAAIGKIESRLGKSKPKKKRQKV
jgi:HEAT repeat protein